MGFPNFTTFHEKMNHLALFLIKTLYKAGMYYDEIFLPTYILKYLSKFQVIKSRI